MPSFVHGKATKVYVNGYDLSSYFSSAQSSKTSDTADVTTFQQDAKVVIPGLTDATIQMDGFLDKTAAASDPVLSAALGSDASIVTHLPEGDATGKTGVAVSAIETSYNPQSSISEANKISVQFQSQVGGEHVTSLAALASRTGGGTIAGVDYGAASASTQAAGYLHVTALNGGTAAIKLQDSADNITYADLVTFSNVTAANTALRTLAAGSASRYIRTVYTITGGTATFWTGSVIDAES